MQSVLLVEDDKALSTMLRDELEEGGYKVTGWAGSADAAIQLASGEEPSWAVVDIGLNGPRDGIEAASELKRRFGTRVIFISGMADPSLRKRAELVGPEGFLCKPFLPAQLVSLLDKARIVDPDRLRDQRNRFLAFAFAGGDILLELDAANLEITYCAGATPLLFGAPPQKLVGKSLFSVVSKQDLPLVRRILERLARTGRLKPAAETLSAPEGPQRVSLCGIRLPSVSNRLYLSVSIYPKAEQALLEAPVMRLPQKPEDFATEVEDRLITAGTAAKDCRLTFVELAAEHGSIDAVLGSVEGLLRAASVDGQTVGRFKNGRFGVLHGPGVRSQDLAQKVASAAQEQGTTVRVSASAVDINPELAPADLAKALVFTVKKFAEEGGEAFSIRSLADGYQAVMGTTLERVSAFRGKINSEALTFVFQPIVNLADGGIHHFEALARFITRGQLTPPAEHITFAEDVGIIHEMDHVVTKRAIEILEHGKGVGRNAAIAVNLSGRSLSNPIFVDGLIRLLKRNRHLLYRLSFELTESSEVRSLDVVDGVIQELRALGCKVSLDDFGAGAAAFHYLRNLDVDFVKIDGSYIKEAFEDNSCVPFLRAISGLCRDLRMETVGEMVETDAVARLIAEVGVTYGQGWHFGKPQADVSRFPGIV